MSVIFTYAFEGRNNFSNSNRNVIICSIYAWENFSEGTTCHMNFYLWIKQLNNPSPISCWAQSQEVKQAFSEFSLMSKYYRMQEQKCFKYHRSVKKKKKRDWRQSWLHSLVFIPLWNLQRVRRDEQSLVLNFYSTFNGCKDTAEVRIPLYAVGLYLAFLQRWQILFYSFETTLSSRQIFLG